MPCTYTIDGKTLTAWEFDDYLRSMPPEEAAKYMPGVETAGGGTIEVDGVQRPRMNSNGKPIAQTDEALRNFWRWFGDSKVVDSSGKPLVVYHGTKADITEFKPSKRGALGPGTYLTSSTKEAGMYTNSAEPGGENVMPVYVRAANPLALKDGDNPFDILEASDDTIVEALYREGYDGITLDRIESPWAKKIMLDAGMEPTGDSKHFVVFNPTQIKSATGNSGEFDGANPDIRFSPSRVFFSQLTTAFEQAPDRIFGPAAQVKAWLASNAAKLQVKKDEIEWTGINDWLDLQGKQKVTKQQVLDYLQQNGVQVEEVMKGAQGYDENNPSLPGDSGLEVVEADPEYHGDMARRYKYVVVDTNADTFKGFGNSERDAIADAYSGHPEYWDKLESTKYQSYTLPGGENYRELLLTLPGAKNMDDLARSRFGKDYMRLGEADKAAIRDEFDAQRSKQDYRSSHWNEANIVAHVRFNDRTDADGNKVLFIEELQSDWGQDGKKKGFVDPAQPYQVFNKRTGQTVAQFAEELDASRDSIQRGDGEFDYRDASGKTIAAPFVTKTEGWLDLGIKRMIAYAVEHGYDKVAFVNGEQSAERYDLSKQVEAIDYTKTDKGYYINVTANGTNVKHGDFTPAELEDVVGKEVVAKMERKEGRHLGDALGDEDLVGTYELRGLDLKVGGEGMKTFYDQIVPQRVREVLKKLGGGKVEEVNLLKSGIKAHMELYGREDFRDRLDREGADAWVAKNVGKQPGFTITPEMKEKVAQGQPLFSPSRNAAGVPIQQAWSEANLPDAKSRREKFIYEIQDKFVDLKRTRDAIRESGIAIRDEFDPYLVEETFHGAAAYRVQLSMEQEFEPILEEMKLRGIKLEDFDKFLHARHAKERNAAMAKINPNQVELDQMISDLANEVFNEPDPKKAAKLETKLRHLRNTRAFTGTEEERNALSGMSNKDADAYLASLGTRRSSYEALGKKVDEITAENRRLMGFYGLETADTVQALDRAYQHYVPLMRELDDSDLLGSGGSGTGAGYSVRGSTLKPATGSLRAVESPMANLLAQREQIIVRGEKMKVARALYGLALTAPNPDFWSVIVPGKMTEKQMRDSLIAANIDPATIQNMTTAPVEQYIDEETGFVRTRVNPMLARDPNAFVVRLHGEDRVILFNSKSDRAVRLVRALKNEDAELFKGGPLRAVQSSMGKVTRWISSVNTQYNPIFGLKNLVRDIQAAAINASTTGISDKKWRLVRDAAFAALAIWKQERGAKVSPEWQKLWDDFRADGGMTGYRDQFNGLEDRVKAIERQLKGNKLLDKTGAGYLLQLLSDYNTAIENGVRLVAYREALKKGMSRQQAASIAKNLTVNFNRKGRTGTFLSSGYAFFNAAVQGNARIVETAAGGHKGKAAYLYASKFLGAGVSLGVAYTAIGIMLMGDDWEEIPEFIRERELIIPDFLGILGEGDNVGTTKTGMKYLRIPMALGFHAIPNVGRNAVEMVVFGDPGARVGNTLMTMMDAANPMGGGNSLLEYIAPSVFDPMIQLANNENAFGRPIAKQNFNENDPTPAPDRFFKSASTFGKWVSQAMDWISGGDGIEPGAIQVTPDQFDFVFGQITGGVGRESLKLYQFLENQITGEKTPESRVPITGMFFGQTRSEQAVVGKFFELQKKVNIADKQLEARDTWEAKDRFLEKSAEARIVQDMKRAQSQLRKLQRARKKADERGDKAEIERLDARIHEIRVFVVDRYNEEREK